MFKQQEVTTYQRRSEEIKNTFRRFGRFGPVYQVLDISRALEDGDIMMKIRVLESKEDLEYPCSRILEDPQENN